MLPGGGRGDKLPEHHDCPLAVWQFGTDLTLVGLSGEVVVDYVGLLEKADPTLEWVTPGHPLFEAVRTDVLARVEDHLRRGAVFFDLHREQPALLDVFAASIKDGRGNTLHRRLFVVATVASGAMALHEPTIFHDVTPAPVGRISNPSSPRTDWKFVLRIGGRSRLSCTSGRCGRGRPRPPRPGSARSSGWRGTSRSA